MDAGLGCRAANDTDGLAGTFASAGIGLGALTANRQAAKMPHAPVTLDALQALEIHADLAAQIAFDDILAVLDGMDNLRELLLGQIFGADTRVDVSLGKNDIGVTGADAIDVAQGDIDALVRWNFYSDDAGHKFVKALRALER